MPRLPHLNTNVKSPRAATQSLPLQHLHTVNTPLHQSMSAQHIPVLPASIQYDQAALQLPAELAAHLTPSTLHQLQLHLHTTLEQQLRHSLHTLQLHYVKVIQQLQHRYSVQQQTQQYKTSSVALNERELYLDAECQRLQQFSIQREVEYQQLKAEHQRLKAQRQQQTDRALQQAASPRDSYQRDVIDMVYTAKENAYPEVIVTSSFRGFQLTEQSRKLPDAANIASIISQAVSHRQKATEQVNDATSQRTRPSTSHDNAVRSDAHSQSHSQLPARRPSTSRSPARSALASSVSPKRDSKPTYDADTPPEQPTIFTITAMDADNNDHIISQRTVSTDGFELTTQAAAALRTSGDSEVTDSQPLPQLIAMSLDSTTYSTSPRNVSDSPTNLSSSGTDGVALISAKRPSRSSISHPTNRRSSVTHQQSDASVRLYKENKELQLQIQPLKQQVKDLQTQLEQHIEVRQQLLQDVDRLTNDLNDSRTEMLTTKHQLTTQETAHTNQMEQQRVVQKQKRLALVTKIKEKDAELVQLQQLVEIGRTTEANFKGALFHLDAMQKKLKHSEQELQSHLALHEDIRQLHRSALDTIQQHDSTIVALRNEGRLAVRKLKKRLVVKSVWFHSQLIKLERLVEICMSVDTTLAAEFVCSVCLDQLTEPITLVPCGHSVCKKCCQQPVRDRLLQRADTADGSHTTTTSPALPLPCRCLQCGLAVCDAVSNHTLESLLSRYTWSSVVLKDARSSIVSTAANEIKTRTMVVV